ncbi:metallophosphoesterase [Kordiimonas lacus]|uniref:Serine/threonine protein phosphatase 1 n=1 Tax=Kordiimonas lacus TaxID=637679 RepID=A0A1G6UBK9_9PROT|nr:metallophosphoesterase [Kordiimonas lacus]SDD38086.1 serine/threonine protein phosphatase 1 [Kordiimonas lacus]
MNTSHQTAPRHIRLPANTAGRDFLLGDLHGEYDHFVEAMTRVNFDPAKDRVISVGDLVDRGPSSYDCMMLLHKPWFYATRGNHETMLLDAQFDGAVAMWMANGGEWFLQLTEEQKDDCTTLAQQMPLAITLELKDGRTIGVCHAEWPGEDWGQVGDTVFDLYQVQAMLWGRRVLTKGKPQSDRTAALTVHGHTPIDAPKKLGSALFIDTGCVYGGTLTLVSVEQALAIQPDAKPSLFSRLRGLRSQS